MIIKKRSLTKIINNTPMTKNDYDLLINSKNSFSKREKIIFIAIVILISALCYFYMFRTYIFNTEVSYQDLFTQRIVCEYTLRGFDPYVYRGAENPPLPELGLINNGFHASPWGCLLGNLFYPGYLTYEQSRIYFFIVMTLLLILVSCVLYSETKDISQDLAVVAFIISITSVDFLVSVHMGNAGFAICALIVIACLLCDKRPYLAGLCLGLAMIKPQSALLFCLAMLLMKKFIPLIVAAVIDIAAWFGTSLLVHKGMLELLQEFFLPSACAGMPNPGIFSLLFENQYHSLFFSMTLGIMFVIVFIKLLPKNSYTANNYFKFFPMCIAASFWCYSYVYDKYIHVIPAIVCIFIIMNNKAIFKKFFFFIFALFCIFSSIVRSGLRRALASFFNVLVDNTDLVSTQLPNTLYEIGFIILGILITIELRRIYKEAK